MKKILLKPIVCIKWNKSPFLYKGKIYSGQKYSCSPDPDMSDFAVDFYNIVYNDIIPQNNILEKKSDGKILLRNKYFAGDTMNSFVSIANLANFEQDNKIRKKVMKYYESYHCLANFWVLPMKIGRNGKKLNYYDSVDEFLICIGKNKEKYKEIINMYSTSDEKILCEEDDNKDKYENFILKHFLQGYAPQQKILEYYQQKNVDDLIDHATKMMELRAENIAKSDKGPELYNKFKDNNLF